MSLLTWILGGTFDSNRSDGESLLASKDYGEARLAFQRALKKKAGQSEEAIAAVTSRIAECCRALAIERMMLAETYFRRGLVEQAFELLDDVGHISDAPEVVDRCARMTEQFEFELLKSQADAGHEMDEEELLAIISGAWSPAMAAELSQMPASFHQGLVAAHDRSYEDAISLVKQAIDGVPDCVFPFLELGKIQLANGDDEEAEASLNAFVERAAKMEDAIDELVYARIQLAQLAASTERYTRAREELMAAHRCAPDNHLPLLYLGTLLREQGELKQSRRTLLNAANTMGSMHPDMRVFRELGLTSIALGDIQDAMSYLSACNKQGCGQGSGEYDPEAAVPLAALYEEQGQIRDACDIYRHLAAGNHREGLFAYHLKSAMLLKQMKAEDSLVEEYCIRARALAKNDDERHAVDVV